MHWYGAKDVSSFPISRPLRTANSALKIEDNGRVRVDWLVKKAMRIKSMTMRIKSRTT